MKISRIAPLFAALFSVAHAQKGDLIQVTGDRMSYNNFADRVFHPGQAYLRVYLESFYVHQKPNWFSAYDPACSIHLNLAQILDLSEAQREEMFGWDAAHAFVIVLGGTRKQEGLQGVRHIPITNVPIPINTSSPIMIRGGISAIAKAENSPARRLLSSTKNITNEYANVHPQVATLVPGIQTGIQIFEASTQIIQSLFGLDSNNYVLDYQASIDVPQGPVFRAPYLLKPSGLVFIDAQYKNNVAQWLASRYGLDYDQRRSAWCYYNGRIYHRPAGSWARLHLDNGSFLVLRLDYKDTLLHDGDRLDVPRSYIERSEFDSDRLVTHDIYRDIEKKLRSTFHTPESTVEILNEVFTLEERIEQFVNNAPYFTTADRKALTAFYRRKVNAGLRSAADTEVLLSLLDGHSGLQRTVQERVKIARARVVREE